MLDQRRILSELKIPVEFDDERRAVLDAVNQVIEGSRRHHDARDVAEREAASQVLSEALDAMVVVDRDIKENELELCELATEQPGPR